jgi:diguanylate cyclase (GGDEF)-like protein
MRRLLQAVDESYKNYDEDRQLVERSLEHVSNELDKQNLQLRRELVERRKAEDRIQFLACHDHLTGLPNSFLLRERVQIALAHAKNKRNHVAVLCINLDRFKNINDSLGRQTGDRLLQQVAERLKQCVRPTDIVSRPGGDEFIIVLNALPSLNDAANIAVKIANIISCPYRINAAEFHITPSTGISSYPDDGEDIDTLIKHAAAAMSFAKESGRNNYQFFTPELNPHTSQRLFMETSLRRALQSEELVLHYQPQINLDTGRITGMEALVRWQHPELGLISPNEFIPMSEDTGLILSLGEWVLRTACTKVKQWQDDGFGLIHVAVNLSARQFQQQNLTQQVATILKETGLDPCFLELELTESVMMHNPEGAIRTLEQLRKLGVRVSIDDFGTGYSSLSYLKRFPIDKLKIDRSFVHELDAGLGNEAIVTAVITLAHSLNLQVVAEGVESRQQLAFLRAHKCDALQGFLFFPPLPEDEIPSLLRQQELPGRRSLLRMALG